jgi:predicted anti-sigma-YlaC factor YlaD
MGQNGARTGDEVDCGKIRTLLQDELDGLLSPSEARLVVEHVGRCPDCARERAELAALDGVLSDAPIEEAPPWFAQTVTRAIARRCSARRVAEPIGIGVAAAAGFVSAALTFVRVTGHGSLTPVRESASGFLGGAGAFLERLTTMPGFATAWSENPGIAGVVWAFGAAAAAFLAVSALRLAREPETEWR